LIIPKVLAEYSFLFSVFNKIAYKKK
jgi:hypothetical protein